MNPDPQVLSFIDQRLPTMRALLIELCDINSYSYNVPGVERVLDVVQSRLALIADHVKRVPVSSATIIDDSGNEATKSLASCLVATKRADARTRILLNIHADTVYPIDSPFQRVREIDANTLNGPGVVDAKGGIVVLLSALEAFEASPLAKHIGWEVIINSDEEIGSPGSASLLDAAATRNHYGLLYEPALADGSLVSQRKGSGNYTIIVHGRAAHAGRAIEQGRNAIVAASEVAVRLHEANTHLHGATINVGKLRGGTAANVVPDLAAITVNVRANVPEDVQRIEQTLRDAIDPINQREGYAATLLGRMSSTPKLLDAKTKQLLDLILESGRCIGLALTHGPSGGASDGNRLAAAGLPNIDSLGPRGGHLHSDREFIHVDSLAERAKLSLAILTNIATMHAN